MIPSVRAFFKNVYAQACICCVVRHAKDSPPFINPNMLLMNVNTGQSDPETPLSTILLTVFCF